MKIKGSGLKGGSDTPFMSSLSPKKSKVITCEECGKTFNSGRSKRGHKMFYCMKSKNLDPIEKENRRRIAKEEENMKDNHTIEKEDNSILYVVDKEMEKYMAATTCSYSRFRLCENPKNPMKISGFWPALFDYCGK